MSQHEASIDEFMSRRKSVRGNAVFKAYTAKAPASWNAEARTAEFIMSAQVKDRDGDIVMTQGIDTSTFALNPVCLLNHRSSDLIGNWTDYAKGVEDGVERMKGRAALGAPGTTPEIDKAAGLIGAGLLRAASIGFIPKTIKRIVMQDGTPTWDYEIITCELIECSIVTIPANPMALAKGSGPTDLVYHLIEEVLDTYAKDPATGLIVPKAEYEAAHKVATGNRHSIVIEAKDDESRDGFLKRIGRSLGFVKDEPESPPVKEMPTLPTAEEKATAIAKADAASAKAKALLSA